MGWYLLVVQFIIMIRHWSDLDMCELSCNVHISGIGSHLKRLTENAKMLIDIMNQWQTDPTQKYKIIQIRNYTMLTENCG